MGFFEQWKAARIENQISKMQSLEKCPDCQGTGFHEDPSESEFILYDNSYKCPTCNGTGMYSEDLEVL